MDFSFSDGDRELIERVRSVAKTELGPPSEADLQAGRFAVQYWRVLAELGLLGVPLEEKYGGLGANALTTAGLMEALGWGCEDAGLVFSAGAHLFACAVPISEFGSEALKSRYLPMLVDGTAVGANAASESGAGSDIHALKTRAIRDGAEYVLDGEKTWVTNGPVADVFLVYASTAPQNRFLGISAFVVPKDAPGLDVGRPIEKIGLRTAPLSSIYLNGCRIPVSHLVGSEGQGASIFRASMVWERVCLFAAWLGWMERLFEKARDYARERQQFGRPISEFQAISHRIVDMKVRLESARLLVYKACWMKDQGEDAAAWIAMAKLAVSESAVQAALDAIRVFGAMGVVVEGGIESALRDAIPGLIYSGTSEMQKNIVAKELGL